MRVANHLLTKPNLIEDIDLATIGREPPADIVIPARQVSARHADIRALGNDVFEITDLGSTNGTFVNGVKVKTARFRLNDKVELGSFRFEVSRYAQFLHKPQTDTRRAVLPQYPQPKGTPPASIPDSREPAHIQAKRRDSVQEKPAGPVKVQQAASKQKVPKKPEVKKVPSVTNPSKPPGKSWQCPQCQSDQVISIEVYERKNPDVMKVKTGAPGSLAGCYFFFKLLPVFFFLLLLLIPALFFGMKWLEENAVLVGVGLAVVIGLSLLIRASKPKQICERCGHRFS